MALSTLRCLDLASRFETTRPASASGRGFARECVTYGGGLRRGWFALETASVPHRWRNELWERGAGKPGPRSNRALVAMASGPATVELAGALFTFATAFVVPMYTLMMVAPKWEWTKKAVEGSLPLVVLGALYIYLFALSCTPETLPLMFSSKYWLPELSGITRMFSNTITVASAWVHLLAVDLFAARQVFLDGLTNDVETRHSLVFCLMMCPVGIFCHIVTKSITLSLRRGNQKTEKPIGL